MYLQQETKTLKKAGRNQDPLIQTVEEGKEKPGKHLPPKTPMQYENQNTTSLLFPLTPQSPSKE
jgi:hypothetical protein